MGFFSKHSKKDNTEENNNKTPNTSTNSANNVAVAINFFEHSVDYEITLPIDDNEDTAYFSVKLKGTDVTLFSININKTFGIVTIMYFNFITPENMFVEATEAIMRNNSGLFSSFPSISIVHDKCCILLTCTVYSFNETLSDDAFKNIFMRFEIDASKLSREIKRCVEKSSFDDFGREW